MTDRQQDEAGEPFTLPTELTIFEVGEVYQRLSPHMDGTGTCAVSAAGCERMDAAGVQLLIAAARACAGRGRAFTLLDCRPEVRDTMVRLGCEALVPAGDGASH